MLVPLFSRPGNNFKGNNFQVLLLRFSAQAQAASKLTV